MPQDFDVKEELKKLPNKPGVYIMHDKNDKINGLITKYDISSKILFNFN